MNAKQCDCCEKFYKPYRGTDPMRPGDSRTKYFHPYNYIGFYNEIETAAPDKYVDLCPDCMEQLRKWLEAGGSLEN